MGIKSIPCALPKSYSKQYIQLEKNKKSFIRNLVSDKVVTLTTFIQYSTVCTCLNN